MRKDRYSEERFDPDSQIARSETRTDELSNENGDGGAPGILANTPGSSIASAEGGSGSSRSSESMHCYGIVGLAS